VLLVCSLCSRFVLLSAPLALDPAVGDNVEVNIGSRWRLSKVLQKDADCERIEVCFSSIADAVFFVPVTLQSN
jgi:hypothetical protein